jgi:hypothetical protein
MIGWTRADTMTTSLAKLQIAHLVLMTLVLASLSYGLVQKAGRISACRGRLAQIKLLDTQLDATEANLDTIEARLNSIKR